MGNQDKRFWQIVVPYPAARGCSGNWVDAAGACLGRAGGSGNETMGLGTESPQGFTLQAAVSSSHCAQSCIIRQLQAGA